MAIIEGMAVDGDDGSPIIFGVIQIRDQSKQNIIATTNTDEKGEFSVDVPEGQKYWCCLFGQIYQPICFQVTSDIGEWDPLPSEGRRVRVETIKVTLAPVPVVE